MATAYSYNDYLDFSAASGAGHIYTASGGGTVFSADRRDATAFDYFADNCVANDAIYFGYELPRRNFGDIKLYIGTAFAAAAVTFIWEYSNAAHTWTTLAVTDGTSNFTATGERVVSFTLPTTADYALVNGIYCVWVRCRIVSVTTPTEGGAQSTQKVFAKSLGVHIKDAGNTVTNFCAGAYAADVAGGWGVIQKIGSYSYLFNCHVFLGTAADANPTHITDTLKHIEFAGVVMGLKNYSIITLGTLVSSTYKSTKDGCSIYFNRALSKSFSGSSTEVWRFYSSVLMNGSPYSIGIAYNSVIQGDLYTSFSDAGITGPQFNNVYFSKRPDFINATTISGATANYIFVGNTAYALRATYPCYLRNLVNLDCTYIGQCDSATNEFDLVLIDPVSSTYNIYWNPAVTTRGNNIGRHYSFNLKIVDEFNNPLSGCIVTLTDVNGYNAMYIETGRMTNSPGKAGTTVTVSVNSWAVGDYIKLGNEIVLISGGSYPNFTVTRAQLGTSAGSVAARQALKMTPSQATDANGVISEAIVQTNLYSYGSGSAPGVTVNTDYNPFILKIVKPGYRPYISKITINKKFDEVITLSRVKTINLSKHMQEVA